MKNKLFSLTVLVFSFCLIAPNTYAKEDFDSTTSLTIPNLNNISKDNNGRVVLLSHREAIKYCLERGGRLPTAMEFALLAQSLGAKGISPAPKPTPIYEPNDCRPLLVKNPDGTIDRFCFTRDGYQNPGVDTGNAPIWSSSTDHTRSTLTYDAPFYFASGAGVLDTSSPVFKYAVLCVLNPI